MAIVARSILSARNCKAVLFIVQVEDEIQNPWHTLRREKERTHVSTELLRCPNMNTTGRLTGFALLHVGMEVGLTQTVEPPDGVVDATGNLVGVDFHAHEPLSHRRHFFLSSGQ